MPLRLLVVLLAISFSPSFACAAEVSGTVKSMAGNPVAGVTVYGSDLGTCCPFRRQQTATDLTGHFHLSNPGKVIYFRKSGFRPVSKVITEVVGDVDVVLEGAGTSSLQIKVCGRYRRGGAEVGQFVRFVFPKSAKVKEVRDTDYIAYYVRFEKEENRLKIWLGPTVGGTDADERLFVGSIHYSERWTVVPDLGGEVGIDAQGLAHNGKKWRSIGILGTALATYSEVSDAAASFFDGIIDSVCVVKPEPTGHPQR